MWRLDSVVNCPTNRNIINKVFIHNYKKNVQSFDSTELHQNHLFFTRTSRLTQYSLLYTSHNPQSNFVSVFGKKKDKVFQNFWLILLLLFTKWLSNENRFELHDKPYFCWCCCCCSVTAGYWRFSFRNFFHELNQKGKRAHRNVPSHFEFAVKYIFTFVSPRTFESIHNFSDRRKMIYRAMRE